MHNHLFMLLLIGFFLWWWCLVWCILSLVDASWAELDRMARAKQSLCTFAMIPLLPRLMERSSTFYYWYYRLLIQSATLCNLAQCSH